MKPNTKSPFFKLSLVFVAIFLVQDYIEGKLIVDAVKAHKSIGSVAVVYWLGILWLSIAATLYYKTTSFKQTRIRQLLVLIITPFVFAPLAAILYLIFVLVPTYNIASRSGFTG